MKWDVTGAWKSDGRDAVLVVEAPTRLAAEAAASARGLLVERATPQPQASPPPTVGYASKVAAVPSTPAEVPVAKVVATTYIRRPWYSTLALLACCAAALAVLAIVVMLVAVKMHDGSGAQPATVATGSRGQVPAALPTTHQLAGFYAVRPGLDIAFGGAKADVEESLSKNGDPVRQVTWVTSALEIRAVLFAIGDERSPKLYTLCVPNRTGDRAGSFVPALARFASLANDDDAPGDWSDWIRRSQEKISLGQPVVFRDGNLTATLERMTQPEPGVKLTFLVTR